MKPELLHILQHSLGCDEYGQGSMYRNRFITGEGSVDWLRCQELVSMGLMTDEGTSALAGGDHFFWVTDAGVLAMDQNSPKPPKVSRSKQRYQEWLKVSDIGWTFGQWLKFKTKNK